MRRRARVDGNHAQIVRTFRRLGCSVLDLSGVGSGCPDILVGYRGHNLLVEIKDGTKSPSKRVLTPDEKEFFETWKGPKCIITTQEEVITTVNAYFRAPILT